MKFNFKLYVPELKWLWELLRRGHAVYNSKQNNREWLTLRVIDHVRNLFRLTQDEAQKIYVESYTAAMPAHTSLHPHPEPLTPEAKTAYLAKATKWTKNLESEGNMFIEDAH